MLNAIDIKPNIIFSGADDSRGARFIQLGQGYEILVNYSRFTIYRTVTFSDILSGIYIYEFNLN